MAYTLPIVGSIVRKTYAVVDPEGRYCSAEVTTDYDSTDVCGHDATLGIDIETISVRGRRVVSHQGFCYKHYPRRYRAWFSIGSVV